MSKQLLSYDTVAQAGCRVEMDQSIGFAANDPGQLGVIDHADADSIRALTAPVQKLTVHLRGGQGGIFVWDAASTAAEDGVGSPKSAGTVINLTGNTGAGRFVREFDGPINVRWFGAGQAGWNDEEAIGAAIDYATALKKASVYLPRGEYVIQPPPAERYSPFVFPCDPDLDIRVFGDGESTVFNVNDSTSHNFHYTAIFSNPEGTLNAEHSNYTRGGCGRVHFHDFAVEGDWVPNNSSLGGRFGYLMFAFFKLDKFKQERLHVKNWQNKMNRVVGAEQFESIYNEVDFIASDAIRAQECARVIVAHNRLRHCSDDAIAIHSSDNLTTGEPSRYGILIHNNIIEDSRAILCLGGKAISIKDNIVARSRGNCIVVQSVGTAPEGNTSMVSVDISGNHIFDPLTYLNEDTSTFPATTGLHGAIVYGRVFPTANAAGNIPERPNASGLITPPYEGDAQTVSYTWTPNWDNAGSSIGRGVNISNNRILRTLPSGVNYSDWGFGPYRGRKTTHDPVVNDDSFLYAGITLYGSVDGANISGNTILKPFYAGILLQLSTTDINYRSYSNVIVRDNVIKDVVVGMHSAVSESSTRRNWDVTYDNNLVDCDPYHKHAYRNTDGSWQDMSAVSLKSRPTAFQVRSMEGVKLSNNKIWNCYAPVSTENTQSADASAGYTGTNNIVHCYPVSPNYAATNKGVAEPGYGAEFDHVVYNADPTDSGYGEFVNNCPSAKNTTPSAGVYVEGKIIQRGNVSAGTNWGWLRKTTGAGNTVGTDWVALT